MKLRIYSDGGSRGNPGPAASGAVLKKVLDDVEGETIATASKFLGSTTNNQAEYVAIIIGLKKALTLGATEVELYMDSELACKQLKGEYKVKNPQIAERFLEVKQLLFRFKHYRIQHVRRERNTEADAVVNNVLDRHAS